MSTRAREIAELGQKLTVDGSGNLDFSGNLDAQAVSSTSVDIEGTQPRIRLKETDTTDLDVALRVNAGNFTVETRSDAGAKLGDRLRASENGSISFYDDTGSNAKFFWDASAERLGINTTSPSGPIHVIGSNNGEFWMDSWGTLNQEYNDNTVSQHNWTGSGNAYFKQYNNNNSTNTLTNIIRTDGETVFNEGSFDNDFRVESDSYTNSLFVEGETGGVGIRTTSTSQQALHVNGTLYAANQFLKNTNYSVPTGTYVDVYWNDTTTTLNTAYHYTFTLTTTGTGTDSGAKYLVYNGSSGTWVIVPVGISGDSSNHPLGRIDSNKFQIYHNHGSTYTVNVDVVAKYHANSRVKDTIFGPEAYFRYDKGGTHELIGNDFGNNVDFRVESDNTSHMLHIDADTDQMSIGGSTKAAVLTVQGGTTSEEALWIYGEASGKGGRIATIRDTRAVTGTEGMAGLRFTSSPGTDYVIGKYYNGSTSNWTLSDQSGNEYFGIANALDVMVNRDSRSSTDFIVKSASDSAKLVVDAGANEIKMGLGNDVNSGLQFMGGGSERFNISYDGAQRVRLRAQSAPGGDDTDVLSIQTYSGGTYSDRLRFSRNGVISERAGAVNTTAHNLRENRRYYYGSSAFSNPTISLMSLQAGTTSYPQIALKVTVWQLGLSGNAVGINTGYVVMSHYGGVWYKSEQAFAHEFSTYNNNVNPTWSITTNDSARTASISVVGVRKTNYDGYSVEVEVMSRSGMNYTWS